MTEPSATAAPTPVESASVAEDFVDIFVSPSKVFARRAKASATVPFLVVCVLLIGFFFAAKGVLGPIIEAEIRRGMEIAAKSNPALTPEIIDKSMGLSRVTLAIGAVVGTPLVLLLTGLCTWIVGRIFGGTLSFGTGLMIASYAYVPKIIDSALLMVQTLVLDVSNYSSQFQFRIGASRFFDPATTSPGVLQFLGRVDLFTIWVTVLLAVGLVYAGKMPKSKAVPAGIVLWLIGALPSLWAMLRG